MVESIKDRSVFKELKCHSVVASATSMREGLPGLKCHLSCCLLLIQQSSAFKILRTRLKTIPTMNTSSATDNYAIRRTASGGHYAQILSHIPSIQSASQVDEASQNLDSRNGPSSINFDAHLQQFEDMQNQHRHFRVTQSQARKQSQQSQQSQQSRKPPIVPVQVRFVGPFVSFFVRNLYSELLDSFLDFFEISLSLDLAHEISYLIATEWSKR